MSDIEKLAYLIRRGKIEIEQVPEDLREAVQKLLAE